MQVEKDAPTPNEWVILEKRTWSGNRPYFVAERGWTDGRVETLKTPRGNQRKFANQGKAWVAVDELLPVDRKEFAGATTLGYRAARAALKNVQCRAAAEDQVEVLIDGRWLKLSRIDMQGEMWSHYDLEEGTEAEIRKYVDETREAIIFGAIVTPTDFVAVDMATDG